MTESANPNSLNATFEGANGSIISVNGEVVVAQCEKSFAPGTPLTFIVDIDPPITLKAKAKGSKKSGDGFQVTMRLVNIRKEDRQKLLQALG